MSFVMRAATADDLQPLYEMAKLTGGGFTNLPPDRNSLTAKLAGSEAAFSRTGDEIEGETFVLVLEDKLWVWRELGLNTLHLLRLTRTPAIHLDTIDQNGMSLK